MAGLLYYLPGGSSTVVLADLQKAGIAHAFEVPGRGDLPIMSGCPCTKGPDGSAGVVLADHRVVEGIGYFEKTQTWRPMIGGKAWVGFYRDDPPRPADLVCRSPIAGHLVPLNDEQLWLIPVARALDEDGSGLAFSNALPTTVTLNDEGQWENGGVVPRYAALWELATRWWDTLHEATAEASESQTVAFDFQGGYDAALTALATNYRVGKSEIALLGLFNQECCREILNALVDWPTMEAFLKKKRLEPSPVTPGG